MDKDFAYELRRMLLTIIRFHERIGGTHTIQIRVVPRHIGDHDQQDAAQ